MAEISQTIEVKLLVDGMPSRLYGVRLILAGLLIKAAQKLARRTFSIRVE